HEILKSAAVEGPAGDYHSLDANFDYQPQGPHIGQIGLRVRGGLISPELITKLNIKTGIVVVELHVPIFGLKITPAFTETINPWAALDTHTTVKLADFTLHHPGDYLHLFLHETLGAVVSIWNESQLEESR